MVPEGISVRILSLSLSPLLFLPYSVLLSLTFHAPGSDYAASVGPCNQSFNSYCTRKRIIRCCCVLYDGGRNTHRSLASKMAIHEVHMCCSESWEPVSLFRIGYLTLPGLEIAKILLYLISLIILHYLINIQENENKNAHFLWFFYLMQILIITIIFLCI